MEPLETERLVVRAFALADAPVVARLLDLEPDPTEPAAADWLHWTVLSYTHLARLHQPPYGDRAIELKSRREVIGACGYVPLLAPFGQIPALASPSTGFSAEVGLFWSVLPEHRHQGYATEAGRALIDYAVRALRLARIVATTSYDNTASIGVMRRLGMRIEHNPLPEPTWLQVVGVLRSPPDP